MIITVTMNPAIDKTVDLDNFIHGGLNRLRNVLHDAGGKGINVSKTIHALGGKTVATGFIGGNGGVIINKVLEEQDITTDFVTVGGETRTNLKVVEQNGFVTELNEPGPDISASDLAILTEKLLKYANEETLFVFAGSIPNGVPKDIYKTLIQAVKEKGATTLLDADGELFVNAIEAKPHIIKPNDVELQEYFNLGHDASEEELIDMGKKLLNQGIETVIISLGKKGAVFLKEGQFLMLPGLKVEAHSTVGAGDAMVAAVSYALDQKMAFKDAASLGVATSAGAVTTKGTKPPAKALVEELQKQVEIIQL